METLGMRREGYFRKCILRGPGEWRDEYSYAILEEKYCADTARDAIERSVGTGYAT
jgi:RimJ/RimL family protein N-acetyltransferase